MDDLKSSYWRRRADEVRDIAELVGNAQAKAILLRIADDYDELAALARANERYESPPKPAAAVIPLKG